MVLTWSFNRQARQNTSLAASGRSSRVCFASRAFCTILGRPGYAMRTARPGAQENWPCRSWDNARSSLDVHGMKLRAGIADGCVDTSNVAESHIAAVASARAAVNMGTSRIAMVLAGDIVFTFKSRPEKLACRKPMGSRHIMTSCFWMLIFLERYTAQRASTANLPGIGLLASITLKGAI